MYDFVGISLRDSHWGKRRNTYDAECSLHEHRVAVKSEAVRDLIVETGGLHFPTDNKPLGRILRADVPALRLLAGDRLDPSVQLPDTLDFEHKATPFVCVFWRPRYDERNRIASWVLRRNPLFCIELGTDPNDVLHLDTLHTLYLGVYATFVLEVLLRMCSANVYDVIGPVEVVRAVTLKRALSDYKAWATRNNIPKSYQLQQLTPSMVFGKKGSNQLKTKAAETGVLLRWAVEVCTRPEGMAFPGRDILGAAGECVLDYMMILRRSDIRIAWDDCCKLLFLCLRHLTLMEDAGVDYLPKAHMFVHITQKIPKQGNPRFFSTFLDETLNLTIANIAAACHKANWELFIFRRLRLLPLVKKNCAFAAL